MRYGSVCSGIEAATQAWHPLGWEPAFFSEIDKFPRAVLQHHYPDVPLHGDFTTIGADDYGTIDLLVGGTPCQSFSIAGLRGGLGDDRGNLALEYLRLAGRKRPRWLVWENVPGVLSSLSHDAPDSRPPEIDLEGDNGPRDGEEVVVEDIYDADESHALLCFLAGARELGYYGGFRVLDAQHVRTCGHPRAVPQRRRRVFFVGYLGDWRRAAAVLFDRESLSGHPAPRREAGEAPAPTLSARPSGGRGLGTDFDLDGGLISAPVASTLNAAFGDKQGLEDQHVNAGCPLFVATVSGEGNTHALRAEGFDASEDGTVRDTPIIAFDCKGTQVQTDTDGSVQTLRSMSHSKSRQNAGGQIAVAIQEAATRENPDAGPQGAGFRDDGAAYTMEARTAPQAVAFDMRGREGGSQFEGPHETANIRAASGGSSRSYVADRWAVRRLTPVECERLQGFEDNYTNIPWRGKDHAPDGPRYKALGNSMAVNVMRWIGDRIAMVDAL